MLIINCRVEKFIYAALFIGNMGARALVFLVTLLVLISACSIEKTIPVVTNPGEEEILNSGGSDITGKVALNVTDDTVKVPDKVEVKEEIKVDEKPKVEEKEELPPGTHNIIIKDLKLEPQKLTIKKGDIIVWKHEDTWEKGESTRHYIAAHSNEFRSPIMFYGDTFEHTFEKEGTFTYIDVLYKDRTLLRGTVVVDQS